LLSEPFVHEHPHLLWRLPWLCLRHRAPAPGGAAMRRRSGHMVREPSACGC